MIDFNKPIYPEDIKKMSYKELEELAKEIRKFLIENISKTGGHLSSNLGIVELTLALHYVYDSPKDKLIFDVGHQAYVHKIITGRSPQFSTLRQKDGLSGFMRYEESVHDVWEAGHSSTSISAAAGFLEAKELNDSIGEIVVIIGDGAIQNGLAFAALNFIGSHQDKKITIILNDNDMSISKNVGRLSKVFNKIRIKRSYKLFKNIVPGFIHRATTNFKNSIRSFIYGPNIFHTYGFKYFGPIDGHNIREITRYLQHAKESNNSTVIHVKTIKGKGYEFAEKDDLGLWHGVGPFDITTGKPIKNDFTKTISWSEGISEIVLDYAKNNPNIKVICPAMISGSGWIDFQKQLPHQIIDVGIAEEHAVVMAAAMSRHNLIPVVSIYSTFLQRAYDQINHDVCRSNNHVVFLVDRAGIVGPDGDTHQGVFDIAYLSHLPNMTVAMPKDLFEARQLIHYALYKHNGPITIRYPRANTIPINETVDSEITFGSWEIIRPLKKVNVITYGPNVLTLDQALSKDNLSVGLINARFIVPLDESVLQQLNNTTVIVYEEVVRKGSLGTLILDTINKLELQINVKLLAINDHYVTHGSIDAIKKDLKLDVQTVVEYIKTFNVGE